MIETTALPEPWGVRATNGSFALLADTPKGGVTPVGLRPHELLEAAVATCLSMTVRMRAAELGPAVPDLVTRASLERGDDGAAFVTEIAASPALADALQAGLATWPVRRTLSGPLRFHEPRWS